MINIKDRPDSKLIKSINSRTNIWFISPIVVGILLIIFGNNILRYFGYTLVFLAIFAYIKADHRPVVDIYEDYILIYNRNNHRQVKLVYWNTIKDWYIIEGEGAEDQLIMHTQNNEKFYVLMFGVSKIDTYFRTYVDKDEVNER